MNTLTRSESMMYGEDMQSDCMQGDCMQGDCMQSDWEDYIEKYEKKRVKVLAPPMQYDLQFAPANMVYNHIAELTKNDVGATNYLAQIKPDLDEFLYKQKPVVFGYIPAPPHAEITRQVIGLKGYFFKMTTSCCGVYFIWHDTVNNVFLFWGPSKFKVVKAMNSIRWRIFKHYETYKQSEYNKQSEYKRSEYNRRSAAPEPISDDEEDEDYSDMPGLVPVDDQISTPQRISMGQEPDYEHPEQS